MNPGDDLRVTIRDTEHGLLNKIEDLTTGQTGFMVGSAGNGFRHIMWDPKKFTCKGRPYTYHPMYSTSSAPSGQSPTTWAGWSAHTVNVSTSLEIGHFEKPDAGNDPDGEEGPCFPGPTIPGCIGTDADFDGYSYHHVYPDGKAKHPTPVLVSSPASRRHGAGQYNDPYSQVNSRDGPPRDRGRLQRPHRRELHEPASRRGVLPVPSHDEAECRVPGQSTLPVDDRGEPSTAEERFRR